MQTTKESPLCWAQLEEGSQYLAIFINTRHLAFEKVFDEEEWWWDGMGVDKVPEDAR